MKRLKEFVEYKHNKRTIKYALAKYGAKAIEDNGRLIKLVSYIASLDKSDIEKLIVNASANTMEK